jgi:hypothetical protein
MDLPGIPFISARTMGWKPMIQGEAMGKGDHVKEILF